MYGDEGSRPLRTYTVSLWTQAHNPSFAGGRDPSSTGQIPSIMGQSIRGKYTELHGFRALQQHGVQPLEGEGVT